MDDSKEREELIRAIAAAQDIGELRGLLANVPAEVRNPLARYIADAMDRMVNDELANLPK